MEQFFKSVLEQDPMPIVLCNLEHTIVYMNPAAAKNYVKSGGFALVGRSLMDCHSEEARKAIEKVVAWFSASRENNRVFTFHSHSKNKDIYMVALRDTDGKLIGYYEKHESREPETAARYDFGRSLL